MGKVKPLSAEGAKKAGKDAKKARLDEMFAIAFPEFSLDNARFH